MGAYTHGVVKQGSMDLNLKEAKEFAASLLSAIAHCEMIEQQAADYFENERKRDDIHEPDTDFTDCIDRQQSADPRPDAFTGGTLQQESAGDCAPEWLESSQSQTGYESRAAEEPQETQEEHREVD